jgi:hypothetical protein
MAVIGPPVRPARASQLGQVSPCGWRPVGWRRGTENLWPLTLAMGAPWRCQYAASNSAGGTSSHAEWIRSRFHQAAQRAVAGSTGSTVRHGPQR